MTSSSCWVGRGFVEEYEEGNDCSAASGSHLKPNYVTSHHELKGETWAPPHRLHNTSLTLYISLVSSRQLKSNYLPYRCNYLVRTFDYFCLENVISRKDYPRSRFQLSRDFCWCNLLFRETLQSISEMRNNIFGYTNNIRCLITQLICIYFWYL